MTARGCRKVERQGSVLVVAGLDLGALEAEEEELHLDAAVDVGDCWSAVSRVGHLWEGGNIYLVVSLLIQFVF